MVTYLIDTLMVRTVDLIVGLRTENPITTVRRVLSVIERVVANVCFTMLPVDNMFGRQPGNGLTQR